MNSFTLNQCKIFLALSLPTLTLLYYLNSSLRKRKSPIVQNRNKIIFITGCDSGLGFSLAEHSYDLGYRVIAGCYDLNSQGAKMLKAYHKHHPGKTPPIRVLQIDIRKSSTITKAVEDVTKILAQDNSNVFYALINNAAVMTFAEFDWQTENLITNQITTNFLGTCLVTKFFCPLVRQHKGRIINMTSHCSKHCLPGLTIYGGTKAAILNWSEGLRRELNKYGVKVIAFTPGSFPQQSQLLANCTRQMEQMRRELTEEQKNFYGDYFDIYKAYLGHINVPNKIIKMKSDVFYKTFGKLIETDNPKFEYKCEPWRYWFYFNLIAFTPIWIGDYFMGKFVNMPKYDTKN